jgi:hypothetical protein
MIDKAKQRRLATRLTLAVCLGTLILTLPVTASNTSKQNDEEEQHSSLMSLFNDIRQATAHQVKNKEAMGKTHNDAMDIPNMAVSEHSTNKHDATVHQALKDIMTNDAVHPIDEFVDEMMEGDMDTIVGRRSHFRRGRSLWGEAPPASGDDNCSSSKVRLFLSFINDHLHAAWILNLRLLFLPLL